MRALTSKQKKLLDKWYNDQKAKGRTLGLWWSVDGDENFTGDLYQQIDDINPCELIYTNITNYIRDKAMEE
jgi:hypothetical protein